MLAGLGMRLVAHQAGRVWNGNSDAFPLASLRANAKALRELTRQVCFSFLLLGIHKIITNETDRVQQDVDGERRQVHDDPDGDWRLPQGLQGLVAILYRGCT